MIKKKHKQVGDAVLAFLRDELERRYRYENIRRFKEFKTVEPAVVDAFREFALRRVYPEGDTRDEVQEAFATLHDLLRSPRKMAALGSVALSAVWRLGRRLPMAVSAGQQVIAAFNCASTVESVLCDAVLESAIPWKSGLDPEVMKDVFAQLPAEHFEALITSLVHLMELAGNRDTMETGLGLLGMIRDTMAASDYWTDGDRQGVALAMDTLSEALGLFARIDDREVSRFVKGIHAVETDWYQTMRAGK